MKETDNLFATKADIDRLESKILESKTEFYRMLIYLSSVLQIILIPLVVFILLKFKK